MNGRKIQVYPQLQKESEATVEHMKHKLQNKRDLSHALETLSFLPLATDVLTSSSVFLDPSHFHSLVDEVK